MKRTALVFSIVALAGATAHAQWSTASITSPRAAGAAVTVNGLALFAGGEDLGAVSPAPLASAVIDVYDSDTGAWSTAPLSQAKFLHAATVVGNLAMFAGGLTTAFVQRITNAGAESAAPGSSGSRSKPAVSATASASRPRWNSTSAA